MKKEEILLQAIGMLPDEMIMEGVTEELLEGAANIEKEEKKRKFVHKCSYVLATAACFTVIVTGLFLSKRHSIQQPDTINDENINIITVESNSNNIKLYIYKDIYEDAESIGQQKSNEQDKSDTGTGKKEILYGKTVKLEAVKLFQNSSASKKIKEREYIILGMDRDFYFTIPGKPGKTYILNGKNGKKHFVNGKEALCKAGNKVYFDISGGEAGKDIKGSIDIWDKKGVEVTAYIDLYLKNGKAPEPAGRFYIGKKNKAIKDKKGDVYYGFLEIKDGD
ncbi:MAG: hypothetical protein K2K35_02870 [Lachnospiraceae bacterium]|nr:hypothetical protein [Lachnospiraceae bacterium]